MPKGKNAAALFEMIGGTRAADGEPTATRTPSWWWKRPARPASPAASLAPSSPAAPEPMMAVDHDHQMVHFSLSTTTSIVIAFGLLVLIGIAFLIGEHVGKKHGTMTAITSEELMKSAPNPNVMQVPPGASSPAQHADQPAAADDQATSSQQPPPEQTLSQPVTGARQAGLNYVIMQSYPPDMRSLATEAQTALLLHGVPCTIEPPPSRWHVGKDWISVIGTTGFTSIHGPEFEAYVHHIEQANADLHGKFKKLKPFAYKWR